MFSPERRGIEERYDAIINNNKTPDRIMSSPLRVFSPLIDAIRSNQTKATRDFDRFYGNLTSWVNLTPKTTGDRIKNNTTEITNKIKKCRQQESSRTSLTPLLERHSIRERKHSFEKTSPPRFLLETPDSQMQDYRTPTTQSSRLEQMWLDDESKRIERLQSSLSGIKRQSSLLAEDSISKNIPITITNDDDNNFTILSPSDRYQTIRHNNNNINNNNDDDDSKLTTPSPLRKSIKRPNYKRCRLSDISPLKYNDDILTTPRPTNKKTKLIRPTTELRRTPSGSAVHDRFWKEIQELNGRKGLCSPKHRIEKHKITKRVSTNNWASDDGFWSDQSSNAPIASKLNYRLYLIAKEEKEKNLEQRNKMDYEHSCIFD